MTLATLLPRPFLEIALVLFLSFLFGIEREEQKARAGHYVFGGVRSFPLIGLVGYALAQISGGNVLTLALGMVPIGALMTVSYWHKLQAESTAGATTEISALLTYLIGALVHGGTYWIAVAIGIVAVLLLELREALERVCTRVAREEVISFTEFLILAIVVLPVLPDRPLTSFAINPFRTWLVVVAVSGMSYASYVAQKWLKARGGILLTAILGGAYSSTATTIVLARQAKNPTAKELYAGSMLAASGVMYLRMMVLVLLFNPPLGGILVPGFCGLGVAGIAAGAALALRHRGEPAEAPAGRSAQNPLALRSAFLFGVAFLVVLVLTRLAIDYVGRGGLYGLAAIVGLSDVDPFVLGVAQSGASAPPVRVAAAAIVIAAAANNVAKGGYARAFGDRPTGSLALGLLGGFAALGLLPLAWLL